MEIILFWGHFHFERWFKGTRGKVRVGNEPPGMGVQFSVGFSDFIFALQMLSLLKTAAFPICSFSPAHIPSINGQ